jgi:hypothetical protein
MKQANKELLAAFDAFCTIDEILAYDGRFDSSKDDDERKAKLKDAIDTVNKIANKKGITAGELQQKVIAIVQRILPEEKK